MASDNELLREYARSASEIAFAELVTRHLNMVYSAALRETGGDTGLAQEVTQLVFIDLSQKAANLVEHPALAGWLYTSVRWKAANVRRAEVSRDRRQLEYQSMSQLNSSESADATWRQVRPVLDDSLHELEEKDRVVIVLRFFEGLNLKQVGARLGLSENAARMRVDRALERLHPLLSKRGITCTGSALAAALIAGAVAVSAPAGLAASITAQAQGAAAAGSVLSAKVLKSAWATKKVILAGLAVLILGAIGSVQFFRYHRTLLLQLHQWLMR